MKRLPCFSRDEKASPQANREKEREGKKQMYWEAEVRDLVF